MDADSLEPYNLLKSAIEEGLISHQPASKKSLWSKKFAKSPVSEADNTFLLRSFAPLNATFLLIFATDNAKIVIFASEMRDTNIDFVLATYLCSRKQSQEKDADKQKRSHSLQVSGQSAL